LSGFPHVSAEVRARVLRTLEETGYAPNAAARSMRTRSAGTIGVVVARVTNPFYPELLNALCVAVAAAQRHMSLWIADEGGELGALEAVREGSIDGVVYTTVTRDDKSLRLALRRTRPWFSSTAQSSGCTVTRSQATIGRAPRPWRDISVTTAINIWH
jgi:LacI family transcriptional regulator